MDSSEHIQSMNSSEEVRSKEGNENNNAIEPITFTVTESTQECCSARSSASFNSSCLSLPLNFFATVSSTPIKHQAEQYHDEISSVNDQREDTVNKTDENQNCLENKASGLPCLSNTTTSPRVSNLTQSNPSQHCNSQDFSVSNGTAERNPFFCYDHSGAIMFMDTSSPPLACLDRMMNSFRYDPTRPKITGYTETPKKIKPLFDRTTLTEPSSNESVFASGAISGHAANTNESNPFGKTVSQVSGEPAFVTANSTLFYSLPSNDRASTATNSALSCEVEQNALSVPLAVKASSSLATILEDTVDSSKNVGTNETKKNSSVAENPVLSLSGVADTSASIRATQNASSSENPVSSLAGVADTSASIRATQNASVAENPVLSLSGVADTSASIRATQNASVAENPVLSLSGVADTNASIRATQNASSSENVASLSQSAASVADAHHAEETSSTTGSILVLSHAEACEMSTCPDFSAENPPHFPGSVSSATGISHSTPNPSTPVNIVISQPTLEGLFSSPSEVLTDITPSDLVSSVLDGDSSSVMELSVDLAETGNNTTSMEMEPAVSQEACTPAATAEVAHAGLSKIPKKAAKRSSRRVSVRLGKPQPTTPKSNPFGKTQKTGDPRQSTGGSLKRTAKNQVPTKRTALLANPSKLPRSTLVAAGLVPNSFRSGMAVQKQHAVSRQSNAGAVRTSTVSQRTNVKTTTKQNSLRARPATATTSSSGTSLQKPSTSRIVAPRQTIANTNVQTKPTVPRQSVAAPPANATAKTSKLLNIRQNFQRQLGVGASSSSGTRVNARRQSTLAPKAASIPTVQPRPSNANTAPQRSRLKPPSNLRKAVLTRTAGVTAERASPVPSTSRVAPRCDMNKPGTVHEQSGSFPRKE